MLVVVVLAATSRSAIIVVHIVVTIIIAAIISVEISIICVVSVVIPVIRGGARNASPLVEGRHRPSRRDQELQDAGEQRDDPQGSIASRSAESSIGTGARPSRQPETTAPEKKGKTTGSRPSPGGASRNGCAARTRRENERRYVGGGALHVAVTQKRQEAAAGIEAIREAYP